LSEKASLSEKMSPKNCCCLVTASGKISIVKNKNFRLWIWWPRDDPSPLQALLVTIEMDSNSDPCDVYWSGALWTTVYAGQSFTLYGKPTDVKVGAQTGSCKGSYRLTAKIAS